MSNLIIRDGHLWEIREVHTSPSWDYWTCLLCDIKNETRDPCKSGLNPVIKQDILSLAEKLKELGNLKRGHLVDIDRINMKVKDIEEKMSLYQRTIQVLEISLPLKAE